MTIDLNGVLLAAQQRACTHYDERPEHTDITLLVIHNISLPAGQFGTPFVDDLFMGCIDCNAHTSFSDLKGLRVSAHCFIKRTGEVIQYVPFNKRAWHAGVSEYEGQTACNNYSVGIELEGSDFVSYTVQQYQALSILTNSILARFPKISLPRITGHQYIAPMRKTDPGLVFDWQRYRNELKN